MNRLSTRVLLASFSLLLFAAPAIAWADAAADLTAGRAALAASELDKALQLLTSATEALPESVEAHLALAECQLRLGRVEEGLKQYQTVLKLSPNHALAKRIVAGLTGQQSTFAERLAAARGLVAVGAFAPADLMIVRLVDEPAAPAERGAARLLRAESKLWARDTGGALVEALRIMQEHREPTLAGPARVIAALALVGQPDPPLTRITELLAEAAPELAKAGDAATIWNPRAVLAAILAASDDPAKGAELASKLAAPLASIPAGPFRQSVVDQLTKSQLLAARARLAQGDSAGALAILWPMVSSVAIPAADSVLKPVNVAGGWLADSGDAPRRLAVARALADLGKAEFDRSRGSATLLGYWLSAEVLRQLRPAEAGFDPLLKLAQELPALSRPLAERKPGTVLSPADGVQRAIVLLLAERAVTEEQRGPIGELIEAHVARYDAVDDLPTGLAQFLAVDGAAKPAKITWAGTLERFPPGKAHARLLAFLVAHYAIVGEKKFQEAAATLAADANQSLGAFDLAALAVAAQASALYPADTQIRATAESILERYVAAERWEAASDAAARYFAGQPGDAARWSMVRLKIRQALVAEDKRLAANRLLEKTLTPLVKEALAESIQILAARPDKLNRMQAASIAGDLVARYVRLERLDLAEASIAAVADPAGGATLADWALWTRAAILEHQARVALALAASRFEVAPKLPLSDFHKAELALLSELLAKHPQSEYVPRAVDQVLAIASQYQNVKAFDTATAVLSDFLKTHGKLAAAERLEYRVVQISLLKAQAAFAARKTPIQTPDKLSPEYAAAIDALAAFLKAHPTGTFAPYAEHELFSIARVYGKADAWPVVREVLARFALAIPDFRRPTHLKLLEAATWLGELDSQYGLELLRPFHSPAKGTEPSGTALATLEGAEQLLKKSETDLAQLFATPAIDPTKLAVNDPKSKPEPKAEPKPPATKLPPLAAVTPGEASTSTPSDTALALVKQSQQRQFDKIAMLEGKKGDGKVNPDKPNGGGAGADDRPEGELVIALPSGSLLSDAEMKRQDAAADKAYALLIDLMKTAPPSDAAVAAQARRHILWLFGFFEGQARADRAIVYIKRFLADQPLDPAQVALAFQAIHDQLAWAGQRQKSDRINQAWVDARHALFEAARVELAAFIKAYADKQEWANRARLLVVESYEHEARLAGAVSAVRAGGLLAQASDAMLALLRNTPEHPECVNFPQRMWNLADQLSALHQRDASIYVLSQIPIRFPTHPLANQAVMRIAELYGANLANPLKAVETYQEYLSLAGDNESIRAQIYSMAQQLAAKQRFLEALHVYGVFVDSFPTDPRAAEALKAIGQIHQSNEVWDEAIKTYQRALAEYPSGPQAPSLKLAIAECQINLSQWRSASRLYEEFIQQYPKDGQVTMARGRLAILKQLDRYQSLLSDAMVQRNKDDAQFQIGKIVMEQLHNPVKAVAEFRKVVSQFPKSDQADDAQLEIGKSLLALDRLEDARKELLLVPTKFPNSPVADDALFLIAQSYEQQAQRLAGVTVEKAFAQSYEMGQRGAYRRFNEQQVDLDRKVRARRDELKKGGKETELALDEAANSFFQNSAAIGNISQSAREAELKAECDSILEVANRQDRINDSYREAVAAYIRAASDYALGDRTDDSLLKIAQIFETHLKDRPAAMQTYQKIVKQFPGTPVAEDAAWKVAQFYEDEGKHAAAAEAYREFIRNYPASPRVADAQFAMAEVLEQLGQWVDAMDAYETFRQKFGAHPKSQLAMEQINWIKAYRK